MAKAKKSLTEIWNRLQYKMMVADLWKTREMEDALKEEGWKFVKSTAVLPFEGPVMPVTVSMPVTPDGKNVYESPEARKQYTEARKCAARQILGLA